jgi:hypothetical protein
MRKLFFAALIIAASVSLCMAQGGSTPQNLNETIKQAKAPLKPEGIGRAVVVVSDENGSPVKNAFAKLESNWGADQFCETWGATDEHGAIALIPIHMGRLKLKVKAKGYRAQDVTVNADSLNEPVRVTLTRKK